MARKISPEEAADRHRKNVIRDYLDIIEIQAHDDWLFALKGAESRPEEDQINESVGPNHVASAMQSARTWVNTHSTEEIKAELQRLQSGAAR